ncbi:MAG TPA: substrate-binding domain-containing protein [Solirubrobacteraceae bacterium]|jgi:ribose transport system substrate-binding protein
MSAGKRKGRLALASVTCAAVVIAMALGTQASGATATSASATKCGQSVKYNVPDSAGFLKTLPANIRAGYDSWPYSVDSTPWSAFKGVKKPWKIGLILDPVTGPYAQDFLNEFTAQFNAAEKLGLVKGPLVKYILPSYATATPEQQISAVQQMVSEGVNGIVLQPLAGPPLAPAIDAAGKAGVPVVMFFNDIDQSKYVVNMWTQNNSPADAALAGMVKTGNVLVVRGTAGIPVEQAYEDAAVADIAACPGLHIVGTVYGDFDTTTAKTAVSQWLAAHPTTKISAVFQNGVMMAGVVEAFQSAGLHVPPVSDGGCQGGDLSWWLAHKSGYKTAGVCISGNATAWSTIRVLFRILAGDGLKTRDIAVPAPLVTNANLAQFATRGKGLDWAGDPRSPVNGWASDTFLNSFFKKSGDPANF